MIDDRLRTLLLVGLVVVALGAAAASLDTGGFADSTPPDPTLPDDDRNFSGNGPPEGTNGSAFQLTCPAGFGTIEGLAGVVGVAAVLGAAVFLGWGSALLAAVVVAAPAVAFGTLCPGVLPFGALEVLASPAALVGALVAALAGALAVLYVHTGSTVDADAFGAGAGTSGTDLAAVGAAAGAAADRIERQADVDNEVYRAWREMTRHLDVAAPDTTTPGEFAAAAVDAGMSEDDVRALTRLFEEVRYGGRDPSERGERAVTALRRIESAYATAEEEEP